MNKYYKKTLMLISFIKLQTILREEDIEINDININKLTELSIQLISFNLTSKEHIMATEMVNTLITFFLSRKNSYGAVGSVDINDELTKIIDTLISTWNKINKKFNIKIDEIIKYEFISNDGYNEKFYVYSKGDISEDFISKNLSNEDNTGYENLEEKGFYVISKNGIRVHVTISTDNHIITQFDIRGISFSDVEGGDYTVNTFDIDKIVGSTIDKKGDTIISGTKIIINVNLNDFDSFANLIESPYVIVGDNNIVSKFSPTVLEINGIQYNFYAIDGEALSNCLVTYADGSKIPDNTTIFTIIDGLRKTELKVKNNRTFVIETIDEEPIDLLIPDGIYRTDDYEYYEFNINNNRIDVTLPGDNNKIIVLLSEIDPERTAYEVTIDGQTIIEANANPNSIDITDENGDSYKIYTNEPELADVVMNSTITKLGGKDGKEELLILGMLDITTNDGYDITIINSKVTLITNQ